MRTFFLSMLIFAFALLAANGLHAQADTATIVGTVRDASGAVVPGAAVTVTAAETNIATSTRTDTAGNYVITPLKIGDTFSSPWVSIPIETPPA